MNAVSEIIPESRLTARLCKEVLDIWKRSLDSQNAVRPGDEFRNCFAVRQRTRSVKRA